MACSEANSSRIAQARALNWSNAAWSALKVEHDKEAWDLGPTPRKAKIAACISLFVWTFVIVFGRLIAYNWTDCDQNQSHFIQQIEDCKAVPADT